MNKILIFICFTIICSCSGQSRIDPIKTFENELTENASKNFRENSPFPITESLLEKSSYYASFEILGNSGANLLFDLKQVDIQNFESKLKTYSKLENDKLKVLEYDFRYFYNDKLIFLPDIDDDWNNEVLGKADLKSAESEIYLIQEGKLGNTFKEKISSDANYNFSCGIYYFKKAKKLIYWFTISK